MLGQKTGQLGTPRTTVPAAGGSINGMKVLLGLLLFVIAIGAIMGVVVALSSGQPNVALIIGLVATAFFARVGC